ncbi:hypothetical protein FLACOL7796_00010 [Flavobacterium collinsii]|uniref:Uncharacterized protein n=1 Tax=Flavobacterium collinsii TaxID=1114861 RepID=A0ABM8KCD1_9FLAO|nr:hypothetical protein FLACOL7796_00010 [Flavobacterium collinsii]
MVNIVVAGTTFPAVAASYHVTPLSVVAKSDTFLLSILQNSCVVFAVVGVFGSLKVTVTANLVGLSQVPTFREP